MTRLIRKLTMCCALCLVTLLVGCSKKLVIINYEQPVDCQNTVGEFAFFRLTSIQNTDTSAVDFNFKVSKIGVSGHTWELEQSDPRFIAVDNLVTAKTTLAPVPRAGIVMLSVRDVSKTDLGAFQNLVYDTSGGENVLFVRNGGSNPTPPAVIDPSSCNGSTVQ